MYVFSVVDNSFYWTITYTIYLLEKVLRLRSIVIDADASPAGLIAWYNHSNQKKIIRIVRPTVKNQRFGVQRMEMLAIYFAIADNLKDIIKSTKRRKYRHHVVVSVRSDSKSTVDQLRGISQIRDMLIHRIFSTISRIVAKTKCLVTFQHLERSRNIAGLLIEQRGRMEL